jgi:AraC family transcriptional regulator of adaptative response/methylated-DNA-[protein]-cysteine methyltransferase
MSSSNFARIAQAIDYIQANFQTQPSLDEVAAAVHLSPFHFQRLFSDWAGTSPKKFLQYMSLEHAKKLLHAQASVQDTAFDTGLSGAGRLHDLFIKIEGMTPGEYKNGGASLTIHYSYAQTPFGDVIVASTAKGVCHIAFYDDQSEALATLQAKFPQARYVQFVDQLQQAALQIFRQDWRALDQVKLHLKGTDFQLKVWETLLTIPQGRLTTYGAIAGQLGKPKAGRAVGTAIGDNPVAFLIPCHRVIRATGALGGYHWSPVRKSAMIGWEAAQRDAAFDPAEAV